MSALVVIVGVMVAALVVIGRALLVDETRGRIRRHATASVEATIASLPRELQDVWGEEWRADLQEVLSMPLTALLYARNLRVAARELVGDQGLVPAPASRTRGRERTTTRIERVLRGWTTRWPPLASERRVALERWLGRASREVVSWVTAVSALAAAAVGLFGDQATRLVVAVNGLVLALLTLSGRRRR